MSDQFIKIGNEKGLNAYLLPYSATIARITFPDKNNVQTDLILGFDTPKEYETDTFYMGRTIARVANRIRNATFEFDGRVYHLPPNNGSHFIHGGSKGPCFKTWEIVRDSPESVSFSCKVEELEDDLPGNAKIDVTYTINDRNQIIVEHYATCTKPGILAITNHAYWNLDNSETILDHYLESEAAEYVETDETACPTGAILSVTSTNYDFRKARKLRSIANNDSAVLLDNDLVLPTVSPSVVPRTHLRFWSEKSGIEMAIVTSYPVIHLYAGYYLNGAGRNGEIYSKNKALAIEPQFHSAAPNFSHFPDVSLRPGQNYSQEIVYTFSHI
ncbi:unnamed protein product [Caenorhabditis bovis]|uniref:Aldose 1-epimerase n=1 Tax=Caenorhabditis bovis TaxID=2654633 RepID=A0A8S1E1R0_9PELO|nr:unnamed protein product [Caenorhabditis bovis]